MNKRIIYQNEAGGVSIVIPTGDIQDCIKDVPEGVPYEVVNVDDIPSDRTFRNAWEKSGKAINHNLTKCKNIAHDKRRAKRAEEFAPLDIEATIPAKAQQAEAKRQQVRNKYDQLQQQIDAAPDVNALKMLVESI